MNQRGFTLIEMLVVMGVMSLLIPVLATSVRQVSTQMVRNSTRLSALTPLENAGRWLGQDMRLAQSTDLLADGSWWSTMKLEWTSWSDETQYDTYSAGSAVYKRHRVTYSLSGSDLQRQYQICDNWNLNTASCGGSWSSSVSVVARKINTIQFSLSSSIFTINVDSYPRGTTHPGEARTYQAYGALLGSEDPLQ